MCILVHKVGRDQNFKGQCLERPDDAQCQVLKLVNFFKKKFEKQKKSPFLQMLNFYRKFQLYSFCFVTYRNEES